jgi:hypothetical protein
MNTGVSSAKVILQAGIDVGLFPSLPIHQVDIGADTINETLQKYPMCFAFACHKGFFPENLGRYGEVAEALGPTILDFLSGHLISCIGMVKNIINPKDLEPIIYLAETWSSRVGYKGFCLCHWSEMASCLLENPWVMEGWNPVEQREWENHVVTYDWIATEAKKYSSV